MKLTLEQLPEAVSQLLEKVDTLQMTLSRIELELSRPQTKPGLMDMAQAEDYLSISKTTILTMVSRGEIPSYKLGKSNLFSEAELVEWLKTRRRKTTKEVQAAADDYKKSKRG